MKPHKISYIFRFPDKRKERFDVLLDPETGLLIQEAREDLPEWTDLEFEQCPNCPLSADEHRSCPLAAGLVTVVEMCERLLSYDKVDVHCVTTDRVVSKSTTAQKGMSALMGLMMATTGCPHLSFFRPMARFHPPMANEEETIFRAVSSYLLAQYFLARDGREPDLELEGLSEVYRNIETLNAAFARRIRSAVKEDAALNAIVLLDFFAKSMPYALEDSLEEIHRFYRPFIAAQTATSPPSSNGQAAPPGVPAGQSEPVHPTSST